MVKITKMKRRDYNNKRKNEKEGLKGKMKRRD